MDSNKLIEIAQALVDRIEGEKKAGQFRIEGIVMLYQELQKELVANDNQEEPGAGEASVSSTAEATEEVAAAESPAQ